MASSMGAPSSGLELYDLLILVDATYSMSSYLESLRTTLPQVISISSLTDCFSRIGILAYKDYSDSELLSWSGWLDPSHAASADGKDVDLIKFAKALYPMGGGDGPEAAKTGLARAYELMREDATTIILLYTDAPPHTLANGSMKERSSNLGPEIKALKMPGSYGGHGPLFADWVSAAKTLCAGRKKAQVFSILERNIGFIYGGFYQYLSTITRGAAFWLADSKPISISKVTVEVLLAWMGAEKAGQDASAQLQAYMTTYTEQSGIGKLVDENDQKASSYFITSGVAQHHLRDANITKHRVTADLLKKNLPKKATPVQDFAKRYASGDLAYKNTVVNQLRTIINDDVAIISLNPVFGSLWRAVCNDRTSDYREELITAFARRIELIGNADAKARMKIWLEESYDYTAEVREAIELVPEDQRFPCVCLDPTLVFEDKSDENDGKAITSFTRDELLELGRSCDYRILRRLGRVLTRLTYINSEAEMPAHIASASEETTPRIPMALAKREFSRKFWRILLHIVVPGTMLSARPAALLAALSIRMGIHPLLGSAEQEMRRWKTRWNDIEIPENWNVSCLSLLLDADTGYRGRHTDTMDELLGDDDRRLFEILVSYKLLELNLETTLTARIGWTPEKTTVQVGPVVVCSGCQYPRSVTIMGKGGKCGYCLWTAYPSQEDKQEHLTARSSKEDNATTLLTWVECNVRTCRAQYVVIRPETLNVRPKCHYCRNMQTAPTVECTRCLNKVIYPLEYRKEGDDMQDFLCYACVEGRKTVVDTETTATKLSAESGTKWMLRNRGRKLAEPFNKRSLFHTISTAGIDGFVDKVSLFHDDHQLERKLILRGKLVRNHMEVIQALKSWVYGRRTESGVCSLCFSDIRKSDLLDACGRSSCTERICRSCLSSWYGLNAPGRIINTAALSCAFCRRAPAGRTLAKYGMGIHGVSNLRSAVEEIGTWIYGWCVDCGTAKQMMERVCARGAPEEVREWKCGDCASTVLVGSGSMKDCPGCGVVTEKSEGCNHMECICGVHWCWYCREKSTEGEIYGHMEREHGGFYAGQESEDEGNDDDRGPYDSD